MNPYWSLNGVRLYQGHVLDVLRGLDAESVQTCITSPPYWSLRDYGTESIEWPTVRYAPMPGMAEIEVPGCDPECEHVWGEEQRRKMTGGGVESSTLGVLSGGHGMSRDGHERTLERSHYDTTSGSYCLRCGGWRGSLGLEPDPTAYIGHLVAIWREIHRVLRDDGVAWIVIADSYSQGGGAQVVQTKRASYGLEGMRGQTPWIPSKNLLGIPWRLAFALQADGWWLRSDVIWAKGLSFCPTYSGSCMPESVQDRCTKSHEYVFMLSKSARYYYDAEAVKEASQGQTGQAANFARTTKDHVIPNQSAAQHREDRTPTEDTGKRNLRTVWVVGTSAYPGSHYACVDAETECLTVDGWKRHDELVPGELIGAYNLESHRCQFVPLITVWEYDVQNIEMVQIVGRAIDQLLTSNHRCVVRHESGLEDIVRADELRQSYRMLVASEWQAGKVRFPTRLAALCGWYVTEGNTGKDVIHLYQSQNANSTYCDEIRQLLADEGAQATEYICERSYKDRTVTNVSWRVTGAVANELMSLCPNKCLPDGFLQWELSALQSLWDALMKGDGHFRDAGRQTFVQKDKVLIDQVQALATVLGYATTLRKRSQGTWSLYKTESKTRRLYSETTELMSRQSYTGIIWCPQTELGTFVARRNGRVFITGNTFPESLIEPMVKASTSEKGACPKCGKAWERVVERRAGEPESYHNSHFDRGKTGEHQSGRAQEGGRGHTVTTGWTPGCECDAPDDWLADDGDVILSPMGERVGDDPTMITGRAGYNRPRGPDEGQRPITRYEQRHYADQLRASLYREQMEHEAGTAFEHYIRTDRSGARPVPHTLLESWIERGWLVRVAVPKWTPTAPVPCTVLDPFAGTGTTGLVSIRLRRRCVLVELSRQYCDEHIIPRLEQPIQMEML